MLYKYLIIGGGIAGTTAAETIRRKDPDGSIVIVSGENYPLYSRISLFDFIADPEYGDKIFLRNFDEYKEKNIDLMLGEKVIELNTEKREVILKSGKIINFEKLLISSGGTPAYLDIEGSGENVFYYQNLDDAKRIKEKIPYLKSVAVIGGSFAAFELAELFRQFDIKVDIFVRRRFFGGALDNDLEDYLKNALKDKGINLKSGIEIKHIKGGDDKVIISGPSEDFVYDGIAIAVGLKRNMGILKGVGIKCSDKGILADEYLRTNFDGIYAAGDVTDYFDLNLKERILSGSWVGAFTQGKIAGENMAGGSSAFKTMPTYTSYIFDDQFTFLGPIRDASAGEFSKISKNELSNKKYTILFGRNGVLRGAILMNGNEKREHFTDMISGQYKIDNLGKIL